MDKYLFIHNKEKHRKKKHQDKEISHKAVPANKDVFISPVVFYTNDNGNMTERMRISSDGSMVIGSQFG